jgi:hypothetical protein
MLYLLWAAAGLMLAGCCKDDIPLPETPKRTVLVYMAADNSLNSYSFGNIEDMLKGAEGENLNGGNLLVYHDSRSADTPTLIRIKKGKNGTIEKDTIATYPDRNSASIVVMRSVLEEVFHSGNYEAESYGLILWSHGTAWLPSDAGNYLRSFGQDDAYHMEINELKEALQGFRFDFIVFDACYMANIESVYALRDNAAYILASPTEVLANGLPYHQVVRHLLSNDPVPKLLTDTGEAFFRYYNEGGDPRSASSTLVKTDALAPLATLSREILQGKKEAVLGLAVDKLQAIDYLGYSNHGLYDFGDFVKQMASAEQYARFELCLKEAVSWYKTTDIAYYGTGGGLSIEIDRARFCGLSSYVPQRKLPALNTWYERLDWENTVYK